MAQTLDQNGNVVVNGVSTNLPPQQAQQAISASSLTPKTPITIPQFNPSPVDSSIAPNISSQISGEYNLLNKQLEQAQAAQTGQAQNQLDLMAQLSGRTADTQLAQEQSGVNAENAKLNTYAQQLADLNAQASSLNRESQAIPIQNQLAYQNTAGTQSGVQSVNRDQLSQNALKALSLGQQADIAAAAATGSQLRLQAAKDKAQQIVDLKYKPLEDQLALKKQAYEFNKDILMQLDKKRAESLGVAIKKEEQMQAENKANEKAIGDLVINASGQGAPADLVAKANKASSPREAAMILGQYAGDYLKNELLKEQIKKTIADTAKTRSEIVKIDNQSSLLKAQPTGVVTAPNGDAIGIPNETLAAIGKLKLGEGQANAVAFVSRMIQSAKALDNQLGTINPTGGFYETSGYDPTSAGSSFGRLVGSDQSRTYNTNAQDFIRAKLRKESGAVISDSEFEADASIYVPSGAGLDEKDLLLAKTKRDEAIKSMIAQAGPAAPYLQQYYEQSKNKDYDYDPYLDDIAIPSLNKSSQSSNSSSAYANSLLTP